MSKTTLEPLNPRHGCVQHDCAECQHRALPALTATIADLTDVLRRNGFVTCDIAACNCGSWHARYGLPERMAEIKEALSEAGHPLCNENGNLVSRSLQALIAERDAKTVTIAEQAAQIEALRAECEALREALQGMLNIVSDSRGVAGYHLNGDVAAWGEFDELNAAVAAMQSRKAAEPVSQHRPSC